MSTSAQQPLNSKQKSGLYHCDYCKKDITNCIRIRCAECNDFDLCLDCFSVGVEVNEKGHKNNHDYRVMDDMSMPIFTPNWGADEEMLLLEGIEMCGLGHWSEIAKDHVKTKSPAECARHYWSTYIDVPTFPLPDATKSPHELLKQAEEEASHNKQKTGISTGNRIGKDTSKKNTKSKNSGPDYSHVPSIGSEVGFWPLRGDFDVEYQNDMEQHLMYMEITDEDTPEEKELKIQLLEAYCRVLDERERRKQFAMDRKMEDWKRYQKKMKEKERGEKAIIAKYRPFARFMKPAKFDQLVNKILTEERLRRRIGALQSFRRLGIRTLEEANRYEKERKHRENSRRRSYGGVRTARYRNRTGREPNKDNDGDVIQVNEKDILSESEQKLCTQLNLSTQEYMVVKDALIRESTRLGYLTRTSAAQLVDLDTHKVYQLYNYLSKNGLIIGNPEQLQDLRRKENLLRNRQDGNNST